MTSNGVRDVILGDGVFILELEGACLCLLNKDFFDMVPDWKKGIPLLVAVGELSLRIGGWGGG